MQAEKAAGGKLKNFNTNKAYNNGGHIESRETETQGENNCGATNGRIQQSVTEEEELKY